MSTRASPALVSKTRRALSLSNRHNLGTKNVTEIRGSSANYGSNNNKDSYASYKERLQDGDRNRSI